MNYLLHRVEPEQGFDKNIPEWKGFDEAAHSWIPRIIFAGLYTWFYVVFATEPWMFALLPIHFVMGPIHGGIVNWFGHKYGYVNFRDTGDKSRNTLPFDFVTLGELFQNNHHKYPSHVNFAQRMFELDPTYPILKVLSWMRIITFSRT